MAAVVAGWAEGGAAGESAGARRWTQVTMSSGAAISAARNLVLLSETPRLPHISTAGSPRITPAARPRNQTCYQDLGRPPRFR